MNMKLRMRATQIDVRTGRPSRDAWASSKHLSRCWESDQVISIWSRLGGEAGSAQGNEGDDVIDAEYEIKE